MDTEKLIEFLANPVSYEPRPESVSIIQTHISIVAIAGEFVYKVRKAVDFGFLDYSTLERREHFSRREVYLNRRLAPELYLGIVPIVRRDERLCFGSMNGGETPVEFGVHMRRLDDAGFFSSKLEMKSATPNDIDRIADTLAHFYEKQQPLRPIDALKRIRVAIDGNRRICERAVGPELPAVCNDALNRLNLRFLESSADVFARRAESGWIRDCHGDLRPEHIHFGDAGISIYDCIEFNDALRQIDVAADWAFLSMDLAHCGRWDFRTRFVTAMIEQTKDDVDSRLLNFFECYRAAVRGKVAWLKSQEAEVDDVARATARRDAKSYWGLAIRLAMFGSSPIMLCVMGRIGTGKSTLANALGKLLGWSVHASDRIRKELAGVPMNVRADAAIRESLYSAEMSRRTYAELIQRGLSELPHRNGVILDATFGTATGRSDVIQAAIAAGATPYFLELSASDERVRERLAVRASQKDVISDARIEDFNKLSSRYRPPTEIPPYQRMFLDGTLPIDDLLRAIAFYFVDRGFDRPSNGRMA